MSWTVAWTVACLAAASLQISAAHAQGNIDAGKTPAQIFGDTCAGCHRSARELRRASAGFLRSHYTAGSDEASAMANYLAGVGGNEPRSSAATQSQPKRPPTDVAKQPAKPAVEQAKAGAGSGAASGAPPSPAQPQPKSRPSTTAQARALPEARAFQDERHSEPTPPPAPVLQPFEE
jgi:mono/diheme cytochrome c family protein